MNSRATMVAITAITFAAILAVTAIPIVEAVGEEDAADFDSIGEFFDAVKTNGYTYDGNGETVRWSPTSICGFTGEHDCLFSDTETKPAGDGNTPDRGQNANAQYQFFDNEAVDVTIRNVNFVYTPGDFKLCINSGWKGAFDGDVVRNAELQLNNTGSVTFENCTFDHVIVSPFGSTDTTTIRDCTFNNVYNTYAIKDIHSAVTVVTGCMFNNGSGGIYLEGDTPKTSITITDNTFNGMDQNAPAEDVNSRGLIQFSAAGDYSGANFDISGNSSDNDAPLLRLLNTSVDVSKIDSDANPGVGGPLLTSNSNPVRVGDNCYPTLEGAVSEAGEGSTITLLDDVSVKDTVAFDTANVTLDLGGYSVTAADDFVTTGTHPHLIDVRADGVIIESGRIVATEANKHAINVFEGKDVVLRDLDITGCSNGAPLILAGASVTLEGEMTFRDMDGWNYGINLGIGDGSLETEVSAITAPGTVLRFYGCDCGFWADNPTDTTAVLTFGDNTQYYYDSESFVLYSNGAGSELSVVGEAIDREDNPLYNVTIDVLPADATVIIDGYGTVNNGDVIQLEAGTYNVTVTRAGYDTISETLVVGEGCSNILIVTLSESDVPVNPPIEDDDEYVPLPPQIVYNDSDDDSTAIVACAAAAVVAALVAAFLIIVYRKD